MVRRRACELHARPRSQPRFTTRVHRRGPGQSDTAGPCRGMFPATDRNGALFQATARMNVTITVRSARSQHKQSRVAGFHLRETSRRGGSTETERVGVRGAGAAGMAALAGGADAWELDRGGGCTTL